MQVSQLLGALEGRAAALADGVLLCGDFNTDPYDHPPPRSVRARCVPAVLRHPLGLRSAYPLPEDAHGRARWWTTWKKRGEHEVRGTRSTVPSRAPLAPRPCTPPPGKVVSVGRVALLHREVDGPVRCRPVATAGPSPPPDHPVPRTSCAARAWCPSRRLKWLCAGGWRVGARWSVASGPSRRRHGDGPLSIDQPPQQVVARVDRDRRARTTRDTWLERRDACHRPCCGRQREGAAPDLPH